MGSSAKLQRSEASAEWNTEDEEERKGEKEDGWWGGGGGQG